MVLVKHRGQGGGAKVRTGRGEKTAWMEIYTTIYSQEVTRYFGFLIDFYGESDATKCVE